MLAAVLILLVVLWFLGSVRVPDFNVPDSPLFAINGHAGRRLDLPGDLILWLLSTLGILAITGLSSILVIAVIVGLLAALIGALGRPRETVTVIRETE